MFLRFAQPINSAVYFWSHG